MSLFLNVLDHEKRDKEPLRNFGKYLPISTAPYPERRKFFGWYDAQLFYIYTVPILASGYVAGDKLTGSKIITLINSLPSKRTLNIIYFNLLGNVVESPNICSILTYWYFSYQNFKRAS